MARSYALIIAVAVALAADFIYPAARPALFVATILASLPTLWKAIKSVIKFKISIDVFNLLALGISFATGETRSAAFILFMLLSAEIIDYRTEARTRSAITELLRLKPALALKEENGQLHEVIVEKIKVDDIVVVNQGARIPVDGIIVFGSAFVNEASVTGESVPSEKVIGDQVLSGTLNELGVIKVKARKVGKESTIEQMVALTQAATQNKSRPEKLANRFAQIFLPIVAVTGIVTYIITRNIYMTAALFLIACADDMAVAIPLAMVGAIGQAAKKGVVVKGGQYLDVLRKVKTVIFDKTGTLTYGRLAIKKVTVEPKVGEEKFWKLVAIAEKFSEHPKGKAIFKHAFKFLKEVPDADEVRVYKGTGIWVRYGKDEIAIGDENIAKELGIKLNEKVAELISKERTQYRETVLLVLINKVFAGLIVVSDILRKEAVETVRELKSLGVQKILIFTGDTEEIAADVAADLGITEFRAAMKPEDKLRELEKLGKEGLVAMVGDGINDAPSLARADVGIALGAGGTAVAVEAADIVILTDNLERIGEMFRLSRRASLVIRGDIIIWLISNIVGFTLVFIGVADPVFAAFYNFATDFLPLINSSRIFRK